MSRRQMTNTSPRPLRARLTAISAGNSVPSLRRAMISGLTRMPRNVSLESGEPVEPGGDRAVDRDAGHEHVDAPTLTTPPAG